MNAINLIMNMEKNIQMNYISPVVRIIHVGFDTSFCLSGIHEGVTEEEWDEP